jgi:GlcNAc-P-P-Und epimerase
LKALVTGSSGFVGTHLIRRLLSEGHEIVALDIKEPRERHPHVQYLTADVRSLTEVASIGPVDRIYNFAAIHTTPGHLPHEYYETNILGAMEVIAFAERQDVKDIVFTSSISVYGPSEETKTEDSPPEPVSDYGRSKFIAEKIHRKWVQQDTSRKLVTVRPAVVFGPGEGGNFSRLAKLLKTGFFVYPGRKDTIKACIYVEDLINAMEIALGAEERSILFNAAFPTQITLEEIVSSFKRVSFPGAKTVVMPHGLIKLAAAILHLFGGVGIGIHPERVEKLIRSTDVYPGWLVANQFPFSKNIDDCLEQWKQQTGGTFL